MAGDKAENLTRKVGLGETGDTAPTGRGIPQSGGNVLQGDVTSNITVWFGDVGHFGVNGEKGRVGTYGILQTYHGDAIMEDSRRDVGDARGRSSAGNGGNTVSDDIYKETSGNRGTVGGLTTNIRSVCRGEGI